MTHRIAYSFLTHTVHYDKVPNVSFTCHSSTIYRRFRHGQGRASIIQYLRERLNRNGKQKDKDDVPLLRRNDTLKKWRKKTEEKTVDTVSPQN